MRPDAKAREWRGGSDEATAGAALDAFWLPRICGLVVSVPGAFWRGTTITITPQQEDKSSG